MRYDEPLRQLHRELQRVRTSQRYAGLRYSGDDGKSGREVRILGRTAEGGGRMNGVFFIPRHNVCKPLTISPEEMAMWWFFLFIMGSLIFFCSDIWFTNTTNTTDNFQNYGLPENVETGEQGRLFVDE